MPNTANKIKYGISECYYAVKTNGAYDTPVALPGAVSISLSAQGELYKFYADNIEYYRNAVNNGYEGTLELALIPDHFLTAVLGNTLDSTDKVLVEEVQNSAVEFALGFQVEGDQDSPRFWFYNCVATRPEVAGDTKEASIEAQTESITISSSPTEDGYVRVRTTADTPTATYSGWFSDVWEPASPVTT